MGGGLNQKRLTVGSLCNKIHLVAFPRSHITDFAATAFQFYQDCRLQSASEILSPRTFVERDKAGIDGVRLAGIHHTLPFRCGVQ